MASHSFSQHKYERHIWNCKQECQGSSEENKTIHNYIYIICTYVHMYKVQPTERSNGATEQSTCGIQSNEKVGGGGLYLPALSMFDKAAAM